MPKQFPAWVFLNMTGGMNAFTVLPGPVKPLFSHRQLVLAATFDEDLMFRVATAISDEARAKHQYFLSNKVRSIYTGLTFWSPNINIFRDPRWGRGQETYGEDPFLTGRMAVNFIKGLQGNDPKYLKTVATAKHYAVHSGPEFSRHVDNIYVNDRDLYETYLPAFKAAVKEANVQSVMCAYNRFPRQALLRFRFAFGKNPPRTIWILGLRGIRLWCHIRFL